MKQSQAKANPAQVNALLKERLQGRSEGRSRRDSADGVESRARETQRGRINPQSTRRR
jgi:hypothetical protein